MNLKENFSIFDHINLPVVLTSLNIVSGLVSIWFSVSRMYKYAAIFMLVAVFFDFIDGRVARYMKSTSEFGKELDSLCDIVSFGIAPAVLAFQVTKNIGSAWILAAIIYAFFVVAGALRLARFNTTNLKHFQGMPITVNGVVIPLLYFLGMTRWFPFVFLVSAIMMISAFEIKKFL